MEVTLQQLLESRDERAAYQKKILSRYPSCLISFMVNMPGSVKYCDLSIRLHAIGMEEISTTLRDRGYTLLFSDIRPLFTGIEGYISPGADPMAVKSLALLIEENHPLGRLFDIDVMGEDGVPISREAMGRGPRKCLICDEDGAACARSGRHTAQQLITKMQEMLDAYGV